MFALPTVRMHNISIQSLLQTPSTLHCVEKTTNIYKDHTHLGHSYFSLLPLGRRLSLENITNHKEALNHVHQTQLQLLPLIKLLNGPYISQGTVPNFPTDLIAELLRYNTEKLHSALGQFFSLIYLLYVINIRIVH